MLSLIVCSRHPERLANLTRNVKDTIGCPHEWVVIDNASGEHTIFSAYNFGADQSQGEILCFLHEDIFFHSQDWSHVLMEHLADPTCGFVGVSGGSLMPRVPASWSAYDTISYLIQSKQEGKERVFITHGHFNGGHYKEAVALDGLFLAVRKDVFAHLRFDEETFHGFHGYYIDICLQAHVLGYHNRVVNNILIEHFSKGSPNRQWVENSQLLHRKWSPHLPIYTLYPGERKIEKCEQKYLLNTYMKRMIRASYNTDEIQDLLLSSLRHIKHTHHLAFRWYVRGLIYWQRLLKRPQTLIPLFRPA